MGVSYIEMHSNRLEQDMDMLKACMERSRQCLTEVSDIVTALDGQWEGASNSRFNQSIIEDLNFLGEVIEKVADLLECLGYADKEYVECENSVADIIAAVRI
ncbi:MAG: hypothetical protein KH452_01570 [Clostridiales bacterium]|nr:hypothetical protein [Clostridiales bacterium]